MIRTHLYRSLRSPAFYIAILVTLGFSSVNIFKDDYTCVVDCLNGMIRLVKNRIVYAIAAALPFAANFADEWNSKAIVNCVTRKNVISYARSNVAACYISAFLPVFIGLTIFIIIRSTQEDPLFGDTPVVTAHEIVAENSFPFLALMMIVFVFASSCAACAVVGLTVSAFLPNKYVAVCSSFVFCYIVIRVCKFLPDRISFDALAYSSLEGSPVPVFLWENFFFIAFSAVCGVIFTFKVKRRVENELS